MVIQELKKLNHNIKEHANILDWETVGKLTKKRQQTLEKFFQNESTNTIQQEILLIQSEILNNDNEIKSIINQQKKLSIESNLNLKNAFSACNSYQQTHDASTKN